MCAFDLLNALALLLGCLSYRTHIGCGLADNRTTCGACKSGRRPHNGEASRHKRPSHHPSHQYV